MSLSMRNQHIRMFVAVSYVAIFPLEQIFARGNFYFYINAGWCISVCENSLYPQAQKKIVTKAVT